jgi:N-succinyldiaminopimelate aminotransferase
LGVPLTLPAFETSIFAEMSALALATSSVNLGQGFPDTDGPDELLAAAADAITGHRYNQYPPGRGIPELLSAVAVHQRRFHGLEFDPASEILITAGATEAIAATILAFCRGGDSEVVVFEPFYDSYSAMIAVAGARQRVVTLRRDGQRWAFDPDELRRAVGPKTRLIILNSPHNPTGKVFDHEELQLIAELAIEFDVVVLSDEVYEHLVFDGRHVPIATLPGMADRTLTVSSAGKTFAVTGWKIGWACGPAPLIAAVTGVKQFLTYVSCGPLQLAVSQALAWPDSYFLEAQAAMQSQRDQLCEGLTGLGFDVIVPQATYFATVDIGGDGVQFCRELPHRAGVVAIPSSVFYETDEGRPYVRFAFCKRPVVLEDALTRLANSMKVIDA